MKKNLVLMVVCLCSCYIAVGTEDSINPKTYIKAANAGDAEAQYNIAVCYYNGKGVTQDFAEAVKWFRKAAEQGNTPALVGVLESWLENPYQE